MPIATDITQYELYQKGEESGLAKNKIETAMRMLADGELSIEKIDFYVDLSIEEVKAIRNKGIPC